MTKKILLITRNFPPLVGGMERLVFNIHKELSKKYTCDIVGPKGCSAALSSNQNIYECRISPVSVFLLSALLKSTWAAIRNSYSLCIAGSGVTAWIAILACKLRKIPCVTFIHGLDLIVDNRLYQVMFMPAIRHSDIVIANSQNTAYLAEKSGISPQKLIILHPGVELPDYSKNQACFRSRYKLDGNKVLLSVGRLIPRKGLAEFIEYSLTAIIKECPEAILVIIGTEPENALHQTDSVLAAIHQAINSTRLEEHVMMLGRVDDDMLNAAYRESDVFVFPLLEVVGDVEGFGMVAVEAASHGLPTVAFSVGGAPDAIADGKSGFLVTPGDYPGLSRKITGILNDEFATLTPTACRDHAARFHWDLFGDRLHEIIKHLVERKNSK